VFGALISLALPSTAYKETVVLDSVEFHGSRYKSAVLRFRNQRNGKLQNVELSKRMFEYQTFSPGNALELYGKQGVVGVYITGFRHRDDKIRNN
jgi:hypothetical protein